MQLTSQNNGKLSLIYLIFLKLNKLLKKVQGPTQRHKIPDWVCIGQYQLPGELNWISFQDTF